MCALLEHVRDGRTMQSYPPALSRLRRSRLQRPCPFRWTAEDLLDIKYPSGGALGKPILPRSPGEASPGALARPPVQHVTSASRGLKIRAQASPQDPLGWPGPRPVLTRDTGTVPEPAEKGSSPWLNRLICWFGGFSGALASAGLGAPILRSPARPGGGVVKR